MRSPLLWLALALHVRSTLIDCAAEGARYGALADRDTGQGAARAQDLISMSLNESYAGDVTSRTTEIDGLIVVEVEVTAPLPLLGLLGPSTLIVRGHALAEVP